MYEILKESNFLHFGPLGFGNEFEHLKQPSEDDKTERIEKARELKTQGVSQRSIARELGVSEGAVRKWFRSDNP